MSLFMQDFGFPVSGFRTDFVVAVCALPGFFQQLYLKFLEVVRRRIHTT